MDLQPTSTTVTSLEDRSWLGSAHGTDSTDSITLDLSLFDEATHFPDGEINSGVCLAQVTASGLYGPYDGGGAGGLEVGKGYLFNVISVRNPAGKAGAPLLRHGKVKVDKLPANSGHDSGFEADVPNIIHV